MSTQSPERLVDSRTVSESSEREDRSEISPSASPEVARLSCDNCRKRKVKCNRTLPICSLCQKLKHHCVYSSARKRPVRRTRYSELEQRLQNMEKALIEGKSADQCLDARSRQTPSTLLHVSGTDGHPTYQGELVISRPRLVDPCFAWDIPERGLIEPLDVEPSTPSSALNAAEDPANFISGSLPIFSGRGIQWIDQLLGESSFSTMVKELRRPEGSVGQNLGLLTPPANILPTYKIAESNVQGFLWSVNHEVPLFQEDEFALYLKYHQAGQQTLKVGYIAAINVMIAFQKFRCYPIKYAVDSDIYLANALALLPRLLIEGPSTLNVSAVLCMALYFAFTCDCRTAASILGAAVQMMVTAGYNTGKNRSQAEALIQNRLFWNAYIISSDISIYLGNAPVVPDSILSSLPERSPADSRADLTFQDGFTMNAIYERFAIARIQGKVWSMLYSPTAFELPHHQIYNHVIEIEHELEVWKSRIPDFTGRELYDGRERRLICLTLMHLRYYQLVISIHSVMFTRASGRDPQVRRMKASTSVARCVQAARDSISLLSLFNKEHPFLGFLAPNVAWSCDVLCVHVLQNKNTNGAYQDIARLETVAKILEKFTEDYHTKILSQVTNMLYFIAAYGVRVSKTVVEQPAEAWYKSTYVPIPPSVDPRNASTPEHVQVVHRFADYPTDYEALDVPQYRGDGMDYIDPAQWNETGTGPDVTQLGTSFFIHIT
ncbi:hypothetical protein BKA65DRAFT_488680 [Rhexocercosporidium sp. MPI-PUGE-AT-0058]|nr:hypothetical protein BKA65DRAFT_488680 [Rhexocercosporidium sp. MPI-PUGE-AT-0058]